MRSEAEKVARINATRDITLAMLKNPVIEILGAYIILESLQRMNFIKDNAWGNIEQGAAMTAITGVVTVQQIAPALPSILTAGGEALGAVTKALPALAAIGGG